MLMSTHVPLTGAFQTGIPEAPSSPPIFPFGFSPCQPGATSSVQGPLAGCKQPWQKESMQGTARAGILAHTYSDGRKSNSMKSSDSKSEAVKAS